VVLPIEDFLSGVEEAVGPLPQEAVQEVRQETIRNLKASKKPKNNLCVAERTAFRVLRTNAVFTALPVDKARCLAKLLGETVEHSPTE
jgi:hypothetical protein